METPSMDLSISRVQQIQDSASVYFIPFSSPHPLFQYDWPTSPVNCHSIRGLSTSNRIEYVHTYKDQWMRIIHESRATELTKTETLC